MKYLKNNTKILVDLENRNELVIRHRRLAIELNGRREECREFI